MRVNLYGGATGRRKAMTDLKSCPFCGSKASVLMHTRDQKDWIANCENTDCDAEIWSDSKEEAIERWNRRAK